MSDEPCPRCEAIHRAAIGREERILELKAEVNALGRRLGEAPRYPSADLAPEAPRA